MPTPETTPLPVRPERSRRTDGARTHRMRRSADKSASFAQLATSAQPPPPCQYWLAMPPENHLDELTAREREVLDLVRLGLTNEEGAGRPGLTGAGAKAHGSQL